MSMLINPTHDVWGPVIENEKGKVPLVTNKTFYYEGSGSLFTIQWFLDISRFTFRGPTLFLSFFSDLLCFLWRLRSICKNDFILKHWTYFSMKV